MQKIVWSDEQGKSRIISIFYNLIKLLTFAFKRHSFLFQNAVLLCILRVSTEYIDMWQALIHMSWQSNTCLLRLRCQFFLLPFHVDLNNHSHSTLVAILRITHLCKSVIPPWPAIINRWRQAPAGRLTLTPARRPRPSLARFVTFPRDTICFLQIFPISGNP